MASGPIIIIDDDIEDISFIKDAFHLLELKNELIAFDDAFEALRFFIKTPSKPFIVLCDINMPKINGLEVRKKIFDDASLRMKTVPFLFLSTGGELLPLMLPITLLCRDILLSPIR